MVLVDTNILLYAINGDSPHHNEAKAAVESLANGRQPWVLTWGVIYEFLRVATHPRVFPKPLALTAAHRFIASLLASESCFVLAETQDHQQILIDCLKDAPRLAGNMIHDLHYAVLMREHAVKEVLTLDTDFRAFPWVRISNLTNSE